MTLVWPSGLLYNARGSNHSSASCSCVVLSAIHYSLILINNKYNSKCKDCQTAWHTPALFKLFKSQKSFLENDSVPIQEFVCSQCCLLNFFMLVLGHLQQELWPPMRHVQDDWTDSQSTFQDHEKCHDSRVMSSCFVQIMVFFLSYILLALYPVLCFYVLFSMPSCVL